MWGRLEFQHPQLAGPGADPDLRGGKLFAPQEFTQPFAHQRNVIRMNQRRVVPADPLFRLPARYFFEHRVERQNDAPYGDVKDEVQGIVHQGAVFVLTLPQGLFRFFSLFDLLLEPQIRFL